LQLESCITINLFRNCFTFQNKLQKVI